MITNRIDASLRAHFAPRLRADGFVGSGRSFRRLVDGYIHVVAVQVSRSGDQFAVNLGVQPLCIPDACGDAPDPRRLADDRCEFRRRLSESGADQWWRYESTTGSMDVAVMEAVRVYGSVGRAMLDRFIGESSPIATVTPEVFQSGSFDFDGFASTHVRMALALARFRMEVGQPEVAREFAAIGLAGIGGATALRSELERLLA